MERYAELKEAVEKLELVDAHAHNIVDLDSTFPFLRCFSEAEGEALSYVPHSLSFKRSLRDIAKLYGCETSLHAIETHRRSSGLQSISIKCFEAAKIGAILIDDGIEFDKMHDVEWHRNYSPVVCRVLRIEHLAEKILDKELPNGSEWTLDMFTETFMTKLKSVADRVVALKSIAAYRSGLEIDTHVNKKDAEEGLIETLSAGKPIRIQNKHLIDYIFTCSLEVALKFNLPMQIHTGFGDKDLDLRLSNPLHLRTVLEDKRFARSCIVLLHASYPFSKEASYLASVYPQVYVDFGLAVPKLSVHGMISSVKGLLELAPIKKVMFSTDGYAFPETFYLGAKIAREVVFSVLCDACDDGDFTIPEAVEAAEDIFKKNAIRLYKIDGIIDLFDSKNAVSNDLVMTFQKDIVFIRIIWVDTSGQHRCRVVPIKRFYDVVKKNGVGLTSASMAMSSTSDGPSNGTNLTAVGEIRLMPDLSRKWMLPWAQKEEMVLADMHVKPGQAWEYCPREALRRITKILKDEFNLLHAESGKGQFEIALGHRVCTDAADNLIFAREAIRAVARKHGLLATFVPKYSLDDIGSGSHVHISLWENGKNVFMGSKQSSLHGMSVVGEEFMAGVLSHLPSILAFTAPLPNSYDRIQPDTWSGAYLCWGKENREAPLRTACPPGVSDGLVSNFEIKSFDGCANPHLGLASIVAAGIDGLRRHLRLPEPVETNPSSLSESIERLPKELSESVEALEKDEVMKNLIGENLLKAVIGVRKAEIDYYSKNKDAFKQLIHQY
ncbi:PREDICTED: protein fluG isoform X3 [Nelumbo nucifera]|uniref:Protein fluG isoform X3 n=1 Tax=Nelumbo nucifera TaxID=4432 RepID=A0A1U8AHY5_NELNU|nr:PREDICTED: protein fluG isoform X3 [Nelumbo nucifera]